MYPLKNTVDIVIEIAISWEYSRLGVPLA